jgi:hypothetical protein
VPGAITSTSSIAPDAPLNVAKVPEAENLKVDLDFFFCFCFDEVRFVSARRADPDGIGGKGSSSPETREYPVHSSLNALS